MACRDGNLPEARQAISSGANLSWKNPASHVSTREHCNAFCYDLTPHLNQCYYVYITYLIISLMYVVSLFLCMLLYYKKTKYITLRL